MNKNTQDPSEWQACTIKNTTRLGQWTAAWLITMAIATFAPMFLWHENTILTVIAIIINLMVGFGMIIANKRHLNGLDELQQKITFEAMALSLGVGLVVGLSYSLLDTTKVIAVDAEISYLVMLMGVTYLAGILLGNRKYK